MSLYSIGCTYPRPIHTVTESIQTTMNDLMVAVWVLLFVFAVLITDSGDLTTERYCAIMYEVAVSLTADLVEAVTVARLLTRAQSSPSSGLKTCHTLRPGITPTRMPKYPDQFLR